MICKVCNKDKKRFANTYSMCETCRRKIDPHQYLSRKFDHIKRRCDSQDLYIGKLQITRRGFIDLFIGNPEFIRIHTDWLKSGFSKAISPEIDRINNKLGYKAGNLQFLTMKVHRKKTTREQPNKNTIYKPGRGPGSGKHFLGW